MINKLKFERVFDRKSIISSEREWMKKNATAHERSAHARKETQSQNRERR